MVTWMDLDRNAVCRLASSITVCYGTVMQRRRRPSHDTQLTVQRQILIFKECA